MLKKTLLHNNTILLVVILLLSVLIMSVNSAFFSVSNVIDMVRNLIVMVMFGCGCMMVIASGGIDVSFPAVATFAMYCTSKIFLYFGGDGSVWGAYLLSAAIGLGLGLFNAVIIGYFKLPTLIATLGTSSIFSGLLLTFVGSTEISNLPDAIDNFSRVVLFRYTSADGTVSSVPMTVLFPILVCVGMSLLLTYTMIGRGIYALGGDRVAAQRAGFNTLFLQFVIYGLVGLIAGLAGMTKTILMRNCSATSLMGSEMIIIAAVVIGGARITGGYGTVIGSVLGMILMVIISNNLIMLGIPSVYQTMVIGLLIIVGTGITAYHAKRQLRKGGRKL